jgi:hypothetical protein
MVSKLAKTREIVRDCFMRKAFLKFGLTAMPGRRPVKVKTLDG